LGWYQIKPEGCDLDDNGDSGLFCSDQALEVIEHAVEHLMLLWRDERGLDIEPIELETIFSSVLETFKEERNGR